MNWHYSIRGGHTHVAVFMNGGKCGDLCFRNEEFEQIKAQAEAPGVNFITFIEKETHPMQAPPRAALHNGHPLTQKEEGNVF